MSAPSDNRGTGLQPAGIVAASPGMDSVCTDTAGGTRAVPTGRMPVPRRLRRFMRRALFALLALVAAPVVVCLLLPKPELLPPGAEFSRVVLDRDGRVLLITLTSDEKYRLPAKLDALSPELIAATLEMEDRRFFSHHGADLRSLVRAAWGVVSRQHLGGGSTLTMQYARLRWRLDTRSVRGKLTQVFRAVQLERHYGKTDLAEAYFTFAPYGGNVEGAPAASLLWCGKPARELSLREAASLSVLPQSPTKRRPRADGTISQSAKDAQARLMARLRAARGEEPSELDAEFALQRVPVPRLALHFARRSTGFQPVGTAGVPPAVSVRAASTAGGTPAIPTDKMSVRHGVVRTTLDLGQQTIVERSIADFLSRERARGLRNAAAILVHAPTREVRAYVGSAGFFNEAICGQVDGVTARRSPGSALKPFIYALAFDAGLIHPRTLLDDAPRRFAGYNPENSDRGFLGPIPAGEALRRSRNVPAVELLARLPGGGLDSFLRDAGVQLARPRGEYGLSLALGGAEVSLEELAMLYAGLADDGIARPSGKTLGEPRNAAGERSKVGEVCNLARASEARRAGSPSRGEQPSLRTVQPPSPILPREVANLACSARLSPGACWLVLDALRGSEPGAPNGLAWKTGTSHGFRDAWACGVMGEWVLCVWVGNFDGKPMPGLFARDTAAPLLFQTVTRLGLRAKPSPRPAEVVDVQLCPISGELAGPHCPHCSTGKFIAGVSPITVCNVHREVVIEGRREVHEYWPAHRLEQFRRAGLPRVEPPAATATAGPPPRIVSPQPALTYVLRRGAVANNAIPLEATAAPGVRLVHWFAGPRYLGASAPAQPLMWQPTVGTWKIQALDDGGRSARVTLNVNAE